jgi:hypothetical protein
MANETGRCNVAAPPRDPDKPSTWTDDEVIADMKRQYALVITLQDCSNINVCQALAEAVLVIREYGRRTSGESNGYSTDQINRHPIVQLYASKIHDLARMGLSDQDRYGKAYDACKRGAE